MEGYGTKLKHRLLMLTLIPAIVLPLLIALFFTSIRYDDLEDALERQASAQAHALAYRSEFALLTQNPDILHEAMDTAFEQPDVESIAIFNHDWELIAHKGQLPSAIARNFIEKGRPITRYQENIVSLAPIESHGQDTQEALGYIVVEMGHQTTSQEQFAVMMTAVIMLSLGVFISSLFAIGISRDVTGPIDKMAEALSRIRQGELNTRIKTDAKSELSMLRDGINEMAEALEHSHNLMKSNVEQATQELRTSLKKIEEQNKALDDARHAALEASKVKSEFLANMSHEIRTPMNGVLGFCDLLAKTELTAPQKDYLNTIHKSAKNLLQIINDILDFSKLEAGKLNLEPEIFTLQHVIEDAFHILSPLAHEKQLELILFVYQDIPARVHTDPLRIRQVLINLVSNAIKFTEQGHVVVRAMVEQQHEEGMVIKIAVTDTGIGIDEATQRKLFNPFTQADTTSTRQYGGTGLGLVICQKIISQMGGQVGLDSVKGEGSTFWFTFYTPLCEISTLPTRGQQTLANPRIALYEAHPLQAKALKHTLSLSSFRVVQQPSIHAIFKTLEAHDVDLVIIGTNSIPSEPHLLEYIEELTIHYPQLPIFVLLNTEDLSQRESLTQLGVSHVLIKPLATERLLSSIHALSTPPEAQPQTHNPYSSLTVMAVDDNAANLKLVSLILGQLGCEVIAVDSGYDALKACQTTPIDIIFMDIHMPGMDGIETTQKIKALAPNCPVVSLTAHASADEVAHLKKQAFSGFLTKPVSEDSLRKTLQKVLGLKDNSLVTHEIDTDMPTPSHQAIDWSLALKRVQGNEAIAKELMDMLIHDLQSQKTALITARDASNLESLKAIVHKIHGACCYCGVPQLHEVIAELESALKENDKTWHTLLERALTCIDDIFNAYERA